MKKFVIYGTTDFSAELRCYVEADRQGDIAAYVLDRPYIVAEAFDGLPVIAYDELEAHFGKEEIEILVAIGYSKMNDNRKAIFEKCAEDGWRIGSFLHSDVRNLASRIGEGNLIYEGADLRLHAEIGDGNIILSHAVISHDSRVGNFNYFAGNNHMGGRVRIGDNNFFGLNSVIEDNLNIGDHNLIGAGTVLNRSIGDETLAAAAPTRIRRGSRRTMDLFLMKK